MRWLLCRAEWAVCFALLAAGCVAFAQGSPDPTVIPNVAPWWFTWLAEHGGIVGAALGVLGWQLRGILADGVPIVVRLDDRERDLLRELAQRDDDEPPPSNVVRLRAAQVAR